MLKGNTLPLLTWLLALAVELVLFLTSLGAFIIGTGCAIRMEGILGWMWSFSLKNPAYIGVHEELQLQLQVVLDKIEVAVVPDSGGVALNNYSRAYTTICVKEHHHHKQYCHRIHPSLRLLSSHFSIVPLSHPLLLLLLDLSPQLFHTHYILAKVHVLIVSTWKRVMTKRRRIIVRKLILF